MLNFNNLDQLTHHDKYLKTIFGQKKFFFVGGMIRDLLLDRETNMDDVDVTMGGTHEAIKTLIHTNNKEKFSFFDTEKYGTMTIIPKVNFCHLE
jgi:tRNA nucleotidyltransferase/poly(A) polymerase